jgi:hypothetical protein
MNNKKCTDKYKKFNHYHEIMKDQSFVNFGSGKFIADNKRIPLLKALNECGLITRTHCYGGETGYSFISILMNDSMEISIKTVTENHSDRTFPKGTKEILISWKRKD